MPDTPVTSVKFFNPTDLLSASAWHLQSRSPAKSSNRAQLLKADGDEAHSTLYGAQTSDTLVYKANLASGSHLNLSAIVPGTVASGWHIDSVSIKWTQTDYTEISVSLHKHDDCETGRASHADIARKYSPSLSDLPAGFGIPAALKTLVGISDPTIALSEFTYTLAVQHQDETGASGGWLAAENRDGTETVSVSTVGVPSAAPAISGWDCTSSSQSQGNTQAETGSWTFEHHLAYDAD